MVSKTGKNKFFGKLGKTIEIFFKAHLQFWFMLKLQIFVLLIFTTLSFLKSLGFSGSWRTCRLKSRRWSSSSSPKVWTPCGEKTLQSGFFTTPTKRTMRPTGRTWGRRFQRARWKPRIKKQHIFHYKTKLICFFLQSITFDEFKAFCLFTNNLEDFAFSVKLVTGANRPVGMGKTSLLVRK